ncbi:MAG TPA: alpha-L-arabinofuranosidase C-terminal domain-containing protein [Pyrinomonadaceae bacterium]|nr:alpha-L-arabinofuranosidase C-terminal domain-containing protein [Pyrinomonadaceae bacterium]
MVRKADRMESLINQHWTIMGEYDRQHRVKLVVDEWGAWYKPGSELTLTVTNPHFSEPRETEIAERGARAARTQAHVLSMPDVHAHNTFENPNAVQPRTKTVTVAGSVISCRFSPALVTRLQIAYD